MKLSVKVFPPVYVEERIKSPGVGKK